jgi:hypothetical protein
MGWFFIRWVSLLLCSILTAICLALYAAALQGREQNSVEVVRAVKSLPQCRQMRCTLIFELILYLSVLKCLKVSSL